MNAECSVRSDAEYEMTPFTCRICHGFGCSYKTDISIEENWIYCNGQRLRKTGPIEGIEKIVAEARIY